MPETFGPRPGEDFTAYTERLKAECRAKIQFQKILKERDRIAATMPEPRPDFYWWLDRD
jgi:hypothetical protein